MLAAVDVAQFSTVVETIYDAAVNPSQWPGAVQAIAELHGRDKAMLFTPTSAPADGGFVFPHGIPQEFLVEWATRYIEHDLWMQAGIRRRTALGEPVIDSDLVADHEFESSCFYREFLSRMDIRRLCSGLVFDATAKPLPNTVCAIYGGRGDRAFDDRNRQLHALTLRHLSCALGTMLHLRDAELRLASTLAALDRLSAAIVLLDQQGAVVHVNAMARELLACNDGLRLSRTTGSGARLIDRLEAVRSSEQHQLACCIADVISPDPLRAPLFSHGVSVTRNHALTPLLVRMAPLSERSELAHVDRRAVAIVFIIDPHRRLLLAARTLERLYGATPAETRLAQVLLDGGDKLQTIADRLGLSENTIKTQLRGLFEKTRTNRQAELIQLLIGLSGPG